MKYILHDTSSMDDEKLTEVFMKFGYEGTGLFWAILEKIGKQEKPIKTEVLKKQLRVGKHLEKVWSFLEEIGIISSNNGETFNKQLLNYAESYKVKKEKNAERISQWRKNQQDTENVTRNEPVRNTPKVKESKVKRSKEKVEKKECAPAVFLSEDEFTKLNTNHGTFAAMQMIGKLSAFKQSNGKKYVSDYGAINSWVVDWWNEHGRKQIPSHINPQTGATKLVM